MDSEKPSLWSIVIYEIWSHHWCTWLRIYNGCVLPFESLNSRLRSIKLLAYVKCNHLHKHWSMRYPRSLTRFFKWKWSSLLWSDHHLFRHLLPQLNLQFAHGWLVTFPFSSVTFMRKEHLSEKVIRKSTNSSGSRNFSWFFFWIHHKPFNSCHEEYIHVFWIFFY